MIICGLLGVLNFTFFFFKQNNVDSQIQYFSTSFKLHLKGQCTCLSLTAAGQVNQDNKYLVYSDKLRKCTDFVSILGKKFQIWCRITGVFIYLNTVCLANKALLDLLRLEN